MTERTVWVVVTREDHDYDDCGATTVRAVASSRERAIALLTEHLPDSRHHPATPSAKHDDALEYWSDYDAAGRRRVHVVEQHGIDIWDGGHLMADRRVISEAERLGRLLRAVAAPDSPLRDGHAPCGGLYDDLFFAAAYQHMDALLSIADAVAWVDPWVERWDDFERSYTCKFCGEDRPLHLSDCPKAQADRLFHVAKGADR